MVLIYGGSYNGKIEHVKKKFKLTYEDFYFCKGSKLDLSKKVICGLHIFIKNNLDEEGISLEIIKEKIEDLREKIIICDEINSGIVPLDINDRIYREECGKVLQYLSIESDEVYRIFFGLEERLK